MAVVVNGQLWTKSARSMDGLIRAAQSAADMNAIDAALDAFTDAAEGGHLTGVEAEVVARSMTRAIDRLEGAAGGGEDGATNKDATGPLRYGRPVPGVVFRG